MDRNSADVAANQLDDWDQHQVLANSQKGLGVHAMNLDRHVGPMLQTQKLLMSVLYARQYGYSVSLTTAELEMMNLTGDGSGFDMVTIPMEWRDRVRLQTSFSKAAIKPPRQAAK
jgi:hypothetical protein